VGPAWNVGVKMFDIAERKIQRIITECGVN
jgi:hypothetical protein